MKYRVMTLYLLNGDGHMHEIVVPIPDEDLVESGTYTVERITVTKPISLPHWIRDCAECQQSIAKHHEDGGTTEIDDLIDMVGKEAKP